MIDAGATGIVCRETYPAHPSATAPARGGEAVARMTPFHPEAGDIAVYHGDQGGPCTSARSILDAAHPAAATQGYRRLHRGYQFSHAPMLRRAPQPVFRYRNRRAHQTCRRPAQHSGRHLW
jgi:hypothetical protein